VLLDFRAGAREKTGSEVMYEKMGRVDNAEGCSRLQVSPWTLEHDPFCHHASALGKGRGTGLCGVQSGCSAVGDLPGLPEGILELEKCQPFGRLNQETVLRCCGECEWWIRRSQYSHGPDPRIPHPLPAGLPVDVTASLRGFSSFPIFEEVPVLTL
jgi:hypothetical protein